MGLFYFIKWALYFVYQTNQKYIKTFDNRPKRTMIEYVE